MKIPKPAIVTRSKWGAAPASPGLYGSKDLPALYDRITVHHDAEATPAGMTQAQERARMRSHQALHMDHNGWSDIGYHYVIGPTGTIYSGRTILAPGAHVEGHNRGNLGVCCMGAFHLQEVPAAQLAALTEFLAWATQTLEASPERILGHRDLNATECPGKHLYKLLPTIRKKVAARVG